jgi:flagellar biosynthesis anti-sigma factor FlgM
MKVTNDKIAGASIKSVESVKPSRPDAAADAKSDLKSGAVENSSKVNVSERAQTMQKAKAIASDNSVEEAKVARLQKLIDEGQYKVEADKIADRLLAEHLKMPDDSE